MDYGNFVFKQWCFLHSQTFFTLRRLKSLKDVLTIDTIELYRKTVFGSKNSDKKGFARKRRVKL